jgi:hypothetical protein
MGPTQSGGPYSHGYGMYVNNDRRFIGYYYQAGGNATVPQTATLSPQLNLNQWYHVLFCVFFEGEGIDAKLASYVDGQQVGYREWGSNFYHYNDCIGRLTIGNGSYGNYQDNPFNGWIDGFTISIGNKYNLSPVQPRTDSFTAPTTPPVIFEDEIHEVEVKGSSKRLQIKS